MSGGVLLPGLQVLDVITDADLPWRVVRIPGGMGHPVTPARFNTETMVEFYLRDYPQAEPKMGGRFVGGMFAATLLNERNTDVPLVLDPWVPAWSLDVDTMALVCRWLRSLDETEKGQRWYVVDNVTGRRISQGYEKYESAVAVCAANNTRQAGGRYVIRDQNGDRERKDS